MIQVDQHEGSYLSICKHFRAIYDTPCILEDNAKWQQVENTPFIERSHNPLNEGSVKEDPHKG